MKTLISGIQPSNKLTLGNYLGAIRQYVELQKNHHAYIFVADLHVITNPKLDFSQIENNKKTAVCLYQACGLDLEKNHVFYQSDINAHAALAHILMCHTYVGELNRMTQYKDKMQKFTNANGTETVPAGLFTYPVLMAADILLYDADLVPVGSDQKQHLELTRTLANRMNKKYGECFKVPEPYIVKTGSRIMDLVDPTVKMSKSSINEKGTIFLLDDLEVVKKKIMSAKTDSLNQVKYDVLNQPGVSNLISIYSSLTNKEISDIEKEFVNKNYGEFKKTVAEVVVNTLSQIQTNYQKALKEYETKIKPILVKNTEAINELTNKKLETIYHKIGVK
ncbi:MAG: tryptophan--tRNA ligase [Mycoplasma sp.]